MAPLKKSKVDGSFTLRSNLAEVSWFAGDHSLWDSLNLCVSMDFFSLKCSKEMFLRIDCKNDCVAIFAGLFLPYNLYVSLEIIEEVQSSTNGGTTWSKFLSSDRRFGSLI